MIRFLIACLVMISPAFADDGGRAATSRAMTTRGADIESERGASRDVSRGVTPGRNIENAISGRETAVRSAVNRSAIATTAARGATNRAATSSGVAARSAVTRAMPSGDGVVQTSTRRVASGVSTRGVTSGDVADAPINTGRVTTRRSLPATRAPIARATVETVSVSNNTEAATKATPIVDRDTLAQTSDFCKAQYMSCMDNYCNVLDDAQGRCSCSVNIKNYDKTATALKAANIELQEVAQKIQYIGLTRDQIDTLFSQTLAEVEMQNQGEDSTQLKNDLDSIKDLIVDVKSGRASSTSVSTGVTMDLSGLMDFNIDSSGFDLSGLFGGSSTNTGSIANQRGEQLYKTAAARCKASVLKSCEEQGVDIAIITNAYDLEIDKQCLVYERNLTESNDKMKNTVRNAKNVLQKARLMVAQSKNALDLRGCITELDNCMQDDFVCGDDYENCLDPTGKYISEGEIIIGSEPGSADTFDKGVFATWNPQDATETSLNPWSNEEGAALAPYIKNNMLTNADDINKAYNNMAKFLQSKIGYIEGEQVHGMCASVLNQCQAYTFNSTNKDEPTYIFGNEVIKEYLQRVLPQIKKKQVELISEYAQDCVEDVKSCVQTNGYSDTDAAKRNTAIQACKTQIITCKSVTEDTPMVGLSEWVRTVVEETNESGDVYCVILGEAKDDKKDIDTLMSTNAELLRNYNVGVAEITDASSKTKYVLCAVAYTSTQGTALKNDSTFNSGTNIKAIDDFVYPLDLSSGEISCPSNAEVDFTNTSNHPTPYCSCVSPYDTASKGKCSK